MSKKQYTPRAKFERYLKQMLTWQSLPRGSAERAKAWAAWLAQGQHKGGKPSESESASKDAKRIKRKRTGWKLGWRKRIRDDAALTSLAYKAGVLDKPRPDVLPGDFANPDPRVYRVLTPPIPPTLPKKDKPRPTWRQALLNSWRK